MVWDFARPRGVYFFGFAGVRDCWGTFLDRISPSRGSYVAILVEDTILRGLDEGPNKISKICRRAWIIEF